MTNAKVVTVRVHRGGQPPEKTSRKEQAVQDVDGKVYVRHNGRWWMLSNDACGWRSINVGIADNNHTLRERLDAAWSGVSVKALRAIDFSVLE